ncbi:MAG: hypothetical protein WBG14_17380, partial [Rhodococcus sp. (in: high G+C Gram-positive bacteria)]
MSQLHVEACSRSGGVADQPVVTHGNGEAGTGGNFDFPELDASTAKLHLLIAAAEVFELPADQRAHHITGAVQPPAIRIWVWVRDERGGR